jgi:tape measure domain-containing protein
MADDRQLLIKFILQDQTKKGFDAVNKNVSGTKKSLLTLQNAFKLAIGSVVVKQALDLANTFQQVQNQLKLVTNSSSELLVTQEKLFAISQKTRGAFAETVTLYQKLALNSKDLGISQNQLLEITENVNKAIAISGAGSVQASAGILQLSQAFASGRLQGDEFRSISENIPVILDLLATSTGKARGELKKMASEGLLTSDILAKAIGGATARLDEQFSKLSPTINQASTVAGNSLLNLAGALSEVTGVSNLLANSLIAISNVFDGLTSLINYFKDDTRDVTAEIRAYQEELGIANDVMGETVTQVQAVREEFRQQFEGASAVVSAVYSQLEAIKERTELEKELQGLGRRQEEKERIQGVIEEYNKLIKILDDVIAKRQEEANDVEKNNDKQISELEKFVKQNEKSLQSIFDTNAKYGKSELELLRMRQEDELKLIKEQEDAINELIKLKQEDKDGLTQEEHEKYLERLEAFHEERKRIMQIALAEETRLSDLEAEKQLKLQKENYDKQLQIFKDGKFAQLDFSKIADKDMGQFTKDTAISTLEALAQNNKRAFQINKAYKTAEAIMNTAQGVTKALASGNIIMAGIIGAMGIAQVATIQSQQYSGRALGGRVQAGSTYMVGEQGAEMFVPDRSGTIIPNKDLGRATNVNITINANDTQGFDDLLVKRRSVIVNVINDALNSQGREALI